MMHYRNCRIRFTGAMIAALLLLSACGANTTVATSTGSSTVSGPQITVTPNAGALNTAVTIDGSGFPANARVNLHINPSIQTGESQSVGEVVAGDSGQFRLILIMPLTWSDGKPIGQGGLILSATTADGSATASAQYQVQIETAPTLPTLSSADTGSQSNNSAPVVVLRPDSGGPGTRVELSGTNYPVDTIVEVHIGLSGAAPNLQPYATGRSDSYGNVTLQVQIPDNLPVSTELKHTRLDIVVSTRDGVAKTQAVFNYYPAPSVSPNTAPVALTSVASSSDLTSTQTSTATTGSSVQNYSEPVNVSIDFLYSLLRDPSGNSSVVYLSDRLRTEITNNWALPTGLGVQPGYSSFEVVFLSKSEDGVVIKATLTYESGASIRDLTLVKVGDTWRIDKVVSGSR